LRWVFFGVGLIVIMLLRPQGLFAPAQRTRQKSAVSAKG